MLRTLIYLHQTLTFEHQTPLRVLLLSLYLLRTFLLILLLSIPSITLKRSRRVRRDLNQRRNFLLIQKTSGDGTPGAWTVENQEELEVVEENYRRVDQEIKEKETEERLAYRKRLRARNDMTSKQFWKLVRKVIRKSGALDGVMDEHGILQTERELVEEITLRELAKIFKGQRSKIFQFKNQQLISEFKTAVGSDWARWMNVGEPVPEDKFEGEVCAHITVKELTEMIGSFKDDRAPGVDDVTAKMLKAASAKFLSKLTEVVNGMLETGEVP